MAGRRTSAWINGSCPKKRAIQSRLTRRDGGAERDMGKRLKNSGFLPGAIQAFQLRAERRRCQRTPASVSEPSRAAKAEGSGMAETVNEPIPVKTEVPRVVLSWLAV